MNNGFCWFDFVLWRPIIRCYYSNIGIILRFFDSLFFNWWKNAALGRKRCHCWAEYFKLFRISFYFYFLTELLSYVHFTLRALWLNVIQNFRKWMVFLMSRSNVGYRQRVTFNEWKRRLLEFISARWLYLPKLSRNVESLPGESCFGSLVTQKVDWTKVHPWVRT